MEDFLNEITKDRRINYVVYVVRDTGKTEMYKFITKIYAKRVFNSWSKKREPVVMLLKVKGWSHANGFLLTKPSLISNCAV